MASSLKHQKVVKDDITPNAPMATKRMLETFFHFFNFFTALFLFSRSSLFPITLQALSYCRSQFLHLFNHPFYVFLLLNSIILFLYALSNNHRNEFLSTTTSNITVRVASPKNIPEEKQTVAALDSSSEEKPVNRLEVVEESQVLNGTVTAVTTTTHETTTTFCTATATTTKCEDKVSEKKCYRRVRSESYERCVVVARSGGPELRRVSSSRGLKRHGRVCHVEQLNEDEFNRAVEEFIAKQKRMLLEEQNQSHKQ